MIQHDILIKKDPLEIRILNTLMLIRIDMLQAEMHRLGIFPNENYAATLVDKINSTEKERSEFLAENAQYIMEKDGV